MSGFAPLVDWLTKNGVNKILAIILTYILAIGFFALLLFSVLPPLIEQVKEFISKLPVYFEGLQSSMSANSIPGISSENIANLLSSKLGPSLSNLLSVVLNVFGAFISFITVSVFTFYLLLERETLKKNLFVLFPNLPKEKVTSLAHKIEEKLGAYVRGEIFLMLAVGLATYIGLSLLRVEFAIPLAVIAGLLELIPSIGPILSGIPAVMIALVQNPILAIAVVALYILVQQLENSILVPIVMKEAVGLNPLVTIVSLLIGGTLFGLIGALLAVPAAAVIHVILADHWGFSKD
jgi:predicted PurR-regulated permease PerM